MAARGRETAAKMAEKVPLSQYQKVKHILKKITFRKRLRDSPKKYSQILKGLVAKFDLGFISKSGF